MTAAPSPALIHSPSAAACELSVVIATYNRGDLLRRTLINLADQTIDASRYEVIVVDDGSQPPAADALQGLKVSYSLQLVRQKQSGPAAARDRGIGRARGSVLLLIDDDMEVPRDLLEAHLAGHSNGARVVLGRIDSPNTADNLPLFERFHLHQIKQYGNAIAAGHIEARGVHLCTGNVSLRREDYHQIGGFDHRLERSEDRDLGLRLERLGAQLRFAPNAVTIHHTDHTDLDAWLGRAYRYGLWDSVIGRKHPDLEIANPWRFWYRVSPASRPFLLAAGVWPEHVGKLWKPLMRLAEQVDEAGQERLAMAATTLVYGLAYFAGMREAAGSRRQWLADWRHYRQLRRAHAPTTRFLHAVRADHESVRRYRQKYHQQDIDARLLPVHIATKIGLQMLVMVRLMHLARDLDLPGVPQIISRGIRHLYGAEINWRAEIAPGISIVHGNGLVIGHGVKVGPGCILSQSVTLGEGIHPHTRQVGSPHLTRDIHVGPGAVLLGPIELGEASKVMAGSVLTESVPPRSLVRPAPTQIDPREPKQEEVN